MVRLGTERQKKESGELGKLFEKDYVFAFPLAVPHYSRLQTSIRRPGGRTSSRLLVKAAGRFPVPCLEVLFASPYPQTTRTPRPGALVVVCIMHSLTRKISIIASFDSPFTLPALSLLSRGSRFCDSELGLLWPRLAQPGALLLSRCGSTTRLASPPPPPLSHTLTHWAWTSSSD